MIHARMIENREAGADRAAFGIVRAIDEALNASLHHRAGAHRARLDGDVYRRARETIIPHGFCRSAERDHFRVRRRIAIGNRAVGCAGDDSLIQDDDAADRNFSGTFSGRSLFEGHAHANFIGGGIRGAVPRMVHGASE